MANARYGGFDMNAGTRRRSGGIGVLVLVLYVLLVILLMAVFI